MSQKNWDDLYERLTSRKLWLCLMAVAFACWNYAEGRLTPEDFQKAVIASIGIYTAAEGVVDAAAAWRPKRSPDSVVNVDASQGPPAPPDMPPPAPAIPPAQLMEIRALVERLSALYLEPRKG